MRNRPRVGMGVMVNHGDRLLMIRRKHSHGRGTWAPPGGHLEFGESLEECAIRKVKEDAGVTIAKARFAGLTNDLFDQFGKHYITIWMDGRFEGGEPNIGSAREISAAGWYAWDALPTPFFLTFLNVVRGTNSYGFHAHQRMRSTILDYCLSESNILNDPGSSDRNRASASSRHTVDRRIPRVGLGIVVTSGEGVLMLKRSNPHGWGTWTAPGGHLEYGESPEEGAVREVREETGLSVTDVKVIGITNDIFYQTDKHYVTIWMEGRCLSGEPVVKSPNEISAVGWHAWDTLPRPLFLTFRNLLDGNCYLLQKRESILPPR